MRGARTGTTCRARSLRQSDNDAEASMWSALRGRRLNGFKFVRQLPIGPYFADFACRNEMLVVEIDGSQHVGSISDQVRNSFMIDRGWSVARFWHIDVLKDREAILRTLVEILEGRLTKPVASTEFTFLPARVMS